MANFSKENIGEQREKLAEWLKENKVLFRVVEIFASMIIGAMALETDNPFLKVGGFVAGATIFLDAIMTPLEVSSRKKKKK